MGRVASCRWLQHFTASVLKLEPVCFYETKVGLSIYQTRKRHKCHSVILGATGFSEILVRIHQCARRHKSFVMMMDTSSSSETSVL
jgi:hypothetical protein